MEDLTHFRDIKNRMEGVCEKYRICKFKLDNTQNKVLNKQCNQEVIQHYQNYTNSVDLVLKCLSPEHARLIKETCIKKTPYSELGYYGSTFYVQFRKAVIAFFKFFS
jgi:hypothetical protein